MFSSKVIAHSIYDGGPEAFTLEVTLPHSLLPDIMAHRVLSQTIRDRPSFGQLARQVVDNPAVPAEVAPADEGQWLMAASSAADNAHAIEAVTDGPGDRVLNRVLEPYSWRTIILTGTAWQNFFRHWGVTPNPMSTPPSRVERAKELALIAQRLAEQMQKSVPDRLQWGEWHTPYIDADIAMAITDKVHREAEGDSDLRSLSAERLDAALTTRVRTLVAKASAVRCGYGEEDLGSDLEDTLSLYYQLIEELNWAPLEHVATPWPANRQSNREGLAYRIIDDEGMHTPQVEHLPRVGNLLGWRSLRTEAEAVRGLVAYQ